MRRVAPAQVAADCRSITELLFLRGVLSQDAIVRGCKLSGNRYNVAMKSLRDRKKIMTYLRPTRYALLEIE
jgi:hypothetical protein